MTVPVGLGGLDHPGRAVRVAAFDVDGTLTENDCVVPFMREVAGTPAIVSRLLRRPVVLTRSLARRDRDALKAMGTAAAFAGVDVGIVASKAEAFAEAVYAHGLRRELIAELDEHRDAGDAVVLVSASYEVYLRPLGELLGVHEVLGTRLEVGVDGVLTGHLDGPNCRGPEKVVRLHRWFDEVFGGRRAVHLTAYGDSPGDREMLADADVANWVGAGIPVT